MYRDHPRVCGEKKAVDVLAARSMGSPPRVRGKAKTALSRLIDSRITPACAGKSDRQLRDLRRSEDHPRVCGEKGIIGLFQQTFLGSPPRVRGKARADSPVRNDAGITPACAGKRRAPPLPATGRRDHPRVCGEKYCRAKSDGKDSRITPACAGKSLIEYSGNTGRRDHPRVCGEKKLAEFEDETGAGSPPRMRGKVAIQRDLIASSGITPAYAGKRDHPFHLSRVRRDHPRVCGEKRSQPRTAARQRGSPPRMRGKAAERLQKNRQVRITPAYAGKSAVDFGFGLRTGDHPRVCGEKFPVRARRRMSEGSPPRMRGKALLAQCRSCRVGITPAYAGKSKYTTLQGGTFRDHPRVCGEKWPSNTLLTGISGSPPRMRGKGESACTGPCRPGITPAYAGKSIPKATNRRCSEGSPPRMRGKEVLVNTSHFLIGITPAYAGKRRAD